MSCLQVYALVHSQCGCRLCLSHAQCFATQVERSRALCDGLEFCLDRVHAVRVDAANNKLKAIAPVIREHGVEYERNHFNRKLANGSVTLELTVKWIRHTMQHIVHSNDQRVSLANLQEGSHSAYEHFLQIAMVSLVAEYPHWGGEQRSDSLSTGQLVPETLLNDLIRVKALNAHFHTDVLCAAILITVESEVRARMLDGIMRSQLLKTVSDTVMSMLPRPGDATHCIKAVTGALSLSAFLTAADIRSIQTLVEKHVRKDHPVYVQLVSSRLSFLTVSLAARKWWRCAKCHVSTVRANSVCAGEEV